MLDDISKDVTQSDIVNNIFGISKHARDIGQLSVSLRAQELIGRHLGMWQERQDLGAGVTFVIEGLYTEEDDD